MTTFAVIVTVVLLGSLIQKRVYRSSALVEIESERPSIPSVEQLLKLQPITDTDLETQYAILRNEDLVQRVINVLHLDQVEEFSPARGVGDSDTQRESATYERVLQRFQDRLSIDPVKNSRLVTISFESRNPQLSAKVVNTLITKYIELRGKSADSTTDWLAKQLESTKGQLETSEAALQKYARENELLYLDDNKGNSEGIISERLQQLQGELTKAQAARYEKESLYQSIQKGDESSLPGIIDDKVIQELTVQLAGLKREYALLSATFTPDYYKVSRVKNQIDALEAARARERKRAAQRIADEYFAAARREALLHVAFQKQQAAANSVADRASRYNILKREVDSNKGLYENLLQKLKEANVTAGLNASNVRVVSWAEPRRKPVRPRLLLNLALASLVGLSLGIGLALGRDYFDSTLRTSEDVESVLNVPALATIPSLDSLNGGRSLLRGFHGFSKSLVGRGNKSPKISLTPWRQTDNKDQRYAALAEAFGSFRTSVLLHSPGPSPGSLLITSTQPGEGKTTVSTNLAVSLAQLGRPVLLIDADIRRPSLHRAFLLQNDCGLVDYLSADQEWEAVVKRTFIDTLDVITSGPLNPRPADLLFSWRMEYLLRDAKDYYDFIVLDSPALLANIADARILAHLVDGVVLVVRSGFTPRELALRARESVSNIIGVVLNDLDVESLQYGYMDYRAYGDTTKARDGV